MKQTDKNAKTKNKNITKLLQPGSTQLVLVCGVASLQRSGGRAPVQRVERRDGAVETRK
jgi:hypothetical protein